jgi:chemotaxis protein methyltransferase CheR
VLSPLGLPTPRAWGVNPLADIDDILLGALAERDAARRRRRLLSLDLTHVPRPATLSAIVAMLRSDSDLGGRTAAMEVLAALGDNANDVLRDLVSAENVGVRRLAVDVLGLIASPGSLPLLELAAADSNATVRAAALDGVARCRGVSATRILTAQLEVGTPPTVALAALLGLDQLGATVAPALAVRWLADSLTCAAALRLLGRTRHLDPVVPCLFASSRLRVRAAVLGLADGLERGGAIPRALGNAQAHATLVDVATTADWTAAGAAAIVLGHLGDLRGVAAAVGRDDNTKLLPALHRAVEVLERSDPGVGAALLDLANSAGKGADGDILIELTDAVRRRQLQRQVSRSVATPPALGDVEFQAFTNWFAAVAGLAVGQDAKARIQARLLPRLEARGATTFGGYLGLLEVDAGEAAAAIDAVTIHETYFFREHASLDALRREIGPALGKSGGNVDVWSAGCSSGEEPYTLAGILWELQKSRQLTDFSVLGTDVSPTSIAAAMRGTYGARSFRQRVPEDDEGLFDIDGDGFRRPRSELRQRVRFQMLNLCDEAAVASLPQFDLIFCRNVLIYLTPSARRTVLQSFHDHLRPGGALVLGHSESLLHVENPFGLWPLHRGLAYRRSAS